MLEVGLVALLNSSQAVKVLNNGRIYPLLIPANSVLPCITYQLISTIPEYCCDGPTGFTKSRIQIDTWANDYLDSKNLADAVRQTLDGYTGTLSDGTRVFSIMRDNATDLNDEDSRLMRVQTDWLVLYAQK